MSQIKILTSLKAHYCYSTSQYNGYESQVRVYEILQDMACVEKRRLGLRLNLETSVLVNLHCSSFSLSISISLKAVSDLEHTMQPRQASNQWESSCFNFFNIRMTGISYHAWLKQPLQPFQWLYENTDLLRPQTVRCPWLRNSINRIHLAVLTFDHYYFYHSFNNTN